MSGCWVYVCGPSGAGKDSVIAHARGRLAARDDVLFARRLITRPPHPGSDHEPIDEAAFLQLLRAGALAMHWHAHGTRYGVAACYAADVCAGRTVVVNGSRAHLHQIRNELRARGEHVCSVQIVASSASIAARLQRRAREDADAIRNRLLRSERFPHVATDAVIVNEGELSQAGSRLIEFVERCSAARHAAAASAASVTRRTLPVGFEKPD